MTESTKRRWTITGGDVTAMGYENEFTNMNKAYESLEFLEENYPNQPWELKEKK